ncbi:type II secretion system secretin GspD [Comamonas endophytica]|uniref:Type II secretion system secretin GspD n=1 Tax=Comamonas endophytica TaxID=2949090 RepID=A0ABY6GE29_9BURK|nr:MULTISPECIES: type II secretion system secretin GspD [unclassified Acidovorax]MCD2512881.1 type II secretion system secretin GspD [Acidovorax sp. D4N7]UYG52772.1 type II secretion system secretin GspD [Acidovorax sp. 5MLIR]
MTFLSARGLRVALHTLAAAALLACGGVSAQTAVRSNEPVTLNFAGAEIEAVARTMATITGRNVVVDPRVKGTMTLISEKPLAPAQAFQQFLAALRLQGFTVVEAAGLYKVIPEADAKLQTGSVAVSQGGRGSAPAGGQIVTQIFKLNFENAANLVPVLRPLISPNNTINVNPGNNSLVITDYADNVQRLSRIVAAMDVSNATDVEVIPLQHAVASEMAVLVGRLIEGGSAGAAPGAVAQGQSDTSFKTTLMAEPRSNALVVRAANPARLAQVRSLIARLDQPAYATSAAASGNIHVVYLKNADATTLATTLRAAMASDPGVGTGNTGIAASSGGGTTATRASATTNTGSTLGNSGGLSGSSSGVGGGLGSDSGSGNFGSTNQPSTGGQIQADPSTNSLIISAPPPLYRQLRAVIDQLDGRRAQVLIESLIVEVSANKLAQFGVQWQSLLGNDGSTRAVIGNNSAISGGNILGITAGIAGAATAQAQALGSLGAGLNIGIAPRINGRYYLGALANFLQNSGDANVLSTPNLMTLDNEEARIIIGNNVPFVTGSYASTTGTAGVSPFTTVERKDVGLMLRVRPQINENGTVKMSVYQEVSKIDGNTLNAVNGPTTSKRSIESNVLVEDGSIIVLGGLLEDSYSQGEDKVPLFGDLPGVGNLFRSEKRTRNKTNLMVFLRPVVVRDAAAADALMTDRYDVIRAAQQGLQPQPSIVLDNVTGAPVLPTLQPGGPAQPLATVPFAPEVPKPARPRIQPLTVTDEAYSAP